MPSHRIMIAALMLLGLVGISPLTLPGATAATGPVKHPDQAATEEPGGFVTYVVQFGDSLTNIAARFGVPATQIAADNDIAPPYNIFAGQILQIRTGDAGDDDTEPQPTETPGATPTPATATQTYIVQPGDTLFNIARRFGTTTTALQQLNNLTNRDLIFVGQELLIPGEDDAAPTATPAPADPTTIPVTGLPPVEDAGFDYGIEAFFIGADIDATVARIEELGMNWVRVDVDWRTYEPEPGNIQFAQLDTIVTALEDAGVSILFTVSTSPSWARSSLNEEGPPDDFADYADFVGALAERYAGRVAAYQVWEEPNLRREWNSEVYEISAASYSQLLTEAYTVIKAADPAAVVVSAGLAPTGFNDGINAINDRLFLQGMYSSGLADVSDAVGAHPSGFANPPDATCCDASVGVETHFEDASFYFLDTLTDYREIMVEAGDTETPIWVTKFGWGTSEDTTAPPENDVNIFVTYTSLTEQAFYTPQAFEIGLNLGYVGPMFLSNLNGCIAQSGLAEVCYASLIGPDGEPRPVFSAVQAIDKSVREAATPTPTATTSIPGVTIVPPPAATPEVTDSPEATAEITETPAVTGAPGMTEEPTMTQDPVATDEAIMPTEEPAATSET